jgi:hypothetical protein
MNATQRLTTNIIRELAETRGPCTMIVLAGNEAGESEIELNDGLRSTREECRTRGIDPEPYIAAIQDAARHMDAERHMRGDTNTRRRIVIFRSPDMVMTFRVSEAVRPIVATGDRFHVRTLLGIANTQTFFYILALSQNRTRLLKCTEQSSEEVLLQNVPVNLNEARQTRKPDHVLDNRVSAGPSMGSGGGVMFGTSTDAEDKDEYLLHFFKAIDRAVNDVLTGSSDPVIPAGVEHEIALYRRVNSYAHLAEPGIHGAPDGLEGGEMHRRALAFLQEHLAQPRNGVPADFDKKVGTGHASAHITDIVNAAYQGRISHLYLQESATYIGTYDDVRQRVKHTRDPLDSPEDLIESAARETIVHGGIARIVPASAMPNGVPVCALYRYQAGQTPA